MQTRSPSGNRPGSYPQGELLAIQASFISLLPIEQPPCIQTSTYLLSNSNLAQTSRGAIKRFNSVEERKTRPAMEGLENHGIRKKNLYKLPQKDPLPAGPERIPFSS